jgi:opacity protein-like surface antigen
MRVSDAVQFTSPRLAPSTTGQAIKPQPELKRKTEMKKIVIALATVSALAAGASAAQAGVKVQLNFGGYGYGHGGYYEPHYVSYKPKCHFVKVKVVKWIYGEKHVFWKTKKICKTYGYGY